MNYKKKILISSILLIVSLQILLLINNRQKTSFRYFIWNVQEVSIGRLISISFITGLIISTALNKVISSNYKTYNSNEEDINSFENENTINIENTQSVEIPPERDLRDPQPTISDNYRFINENSENESNNRNQSSMNNKPQDDWDNNNSDW